MVQRTQALVDRVEGLVPQAQAGSSSAQNTIISLMRPYLFSYLSRSFYGIDVDDATQVASLKVWEVIPRYEPKQGKSFVSYATVCATNKVLSQLNKKSYREHHQLVSLEDVGHFDNFSWEDVFSSQQPSPEEDLLYKEFEEAANCVLASLYEYNKDFYLALACKRFVGFEQEELSALLGIPMGTVKSRIYRAERAAKDLAEEKGLSYVLSSTT
ncbi:MAG: RNA polymerase sigma factor [Candidatus Woesearchaeota archaeon]